MQKMRTRGKFIVDPRDPESHMSLLASTLIKLVMSPVENLLLVAGETLKIFL